MRPNADREKRNTINKTIYSASVMLSHAIKRRFHTKVARRTLIENQETHLVIYENSRPFF